MPAPATASATFAHHNVTVNAWPVPEGVRYEVLVTTTNGTNNSTSPERVDDVQVYLDGEFGHDLYQSFGAATKGYHTFDRVFPDGLGGTHITIRGHLRLALLKDQTRGVRTLTVAMFDASGQSTTIGYVSVSVDLSATAIYTRPTIHRSLFNLTPGELQANPAALAQVRAAGVNALASGVFTNPADVGGLTTEPLWEASSVDGKLRPALDYCLANDFFLHAAGDDFLRTTAERNWLAGGGFASQSVQRSAYVASTYGGVLGHIDVMDEVDHNPGDTPADAVFIDNWRAYGGAPAGWPSIETQTVYPTPWETTRWADYATRYTVSLDFRRGRSDGWTLTQYAAGVERVRKDFRHAQAAGAFPVGWELGIKLDCNGAFYTKGGPGSYYNPATDTLINPGWRPAIIVAQAWIALAYGATVFRMYSYDPQGSIASRGSAANGSQLQTGSSPSDPVGDRRWDAVAACYGSVALYESKLLAAPVKPAARDGSFLVGTNGALRWAVNLSERPIARAKGGVLITPATGAAGAAYDGSPVPAGGVVVLTI